MVGIKIIEGQEGVIGAGISFADSEAAVSTGNPK
jgi:hypothetical protein